MPLAKIFFTMVACLIFYLTAFPQVPDTAWLKIYGEVDYVEEGYSVQQTSDNGYIIVGTSRPIQNYTFDIYLVRTDSNGDTLWTKKYGGDGWDQGFSVLQTMDDGFMIVGSTSSYGNGEDDVYLIRTDEYGDTIWTKTYGGSGIDIGRSLVRAYDGGFIVVGQTLSWGHNDIYLVRIDNNGDSLWTKFYLPSGFSASASYIAQTNDSCYVIVGILGYEMWSSKSLLMKVNSEGDSIWTHTYFPNMGSWGSYVSQTSDDGYIITNCQYESMPNSNTSFLLKVNSVGDSLWCFRQCIWPSATYSATESSDNGYVAVGNCWDNLYVYKTDIDGNFLWEDYYDETELLRGNCIQAISDGGYVVTGTTVPDDVFLLKYLPETTGIIGSDNDQSFACANSQNYPNPFNASTMIKYELPQQSLVTIEIYDILGRKVGMLEDRLQPAGYHKLVWHAEDLPSGVYFYKLRAGDYSETKKMVLMK